MNTINLVSTVENIPVEKADLVKYSGKWYSLSSLPTFLDKNWRETAETYTLHEKGYYNVMTTYKRKNDNQERSLKSKLFPVEGANNAELKAQYVWPFKADYWIIELADDYSYAVVGHPEKKFLFILARQPFMDKKLYDEIVERCKHKGYETEKLVKQFNF